MISLLHVPIPYPHWCSQVLQVSWMLKNGKGDQPVIGGHQLFAMISLPYENMQAHWTDEKGNPKFEIWENGEIVDHTRPTAVLRSLLY